MINEKRLIDVNAALERVCENCCCDFEECKRIGFCVDYTNIEQLPTVDAVEVVHARWNPIRNFGGGECYGYCTNCKTPVKADNATGLVMNNRFCHWCGAKMDG